MAIRAESGKKQVTFFSRAHEIILEYCQKYRKRRFKWYRPVSAFPDQRKEIADWLSQTPEMLAWFLTPTAYHAPRTYPRFLKEAFGVVPPPTPYEFACVEKGNFGGIKFRSKGIFYLRAYCFGMSIPQLVRITGEARELIEEEMFQDLKVLCAVPQFQLWCAKIDWSKTFWPINLDVGMLKKLEIQSTLVKGEHLLTNDMVKLLTDSPYFWSFVRDGHLKQRRGFRPGLHKNWLGLYSQRRQNGAKN
jgi:hypothetical protein